MKPYRETLLNNLTAPCSAFTMAHTPVTNTLVMYITSEYQPRSTFTTSNDIVTFTTIIPSGIQVDAVYQFIPTVDAALNTPATVGNPLKITTNNTVVQGATSTGKFLVVDLNGKNAALPLYSFQYTTPELELITPYTNFVVDHGIIVESATPYNVALAVNVYNDAGEVEYNIGLPLYKLPSQEDATMPTVILNKETIGVDITGTDEFLIVSVDNEAYGIPLVNFGSLFPLMCAVDQTDIISTTVIGVNPIQWDGPKGTGSTNLNSKIKTYSQLIHRTKTQLGFPVVNIEICDDEQICGFIDIAIEWYTKYAGYTEEYLIFSSGLYQEPGLEIDKLFSITPNMRNTNSKGLSALWDYDLGDYRKVTGVFAFEPGESTGINTLFTLEQAMAQQTYFSYMLGNAGFDLVTWEVLKEWLDLREKVLAQTYYVDFDERTQILRLIPPPSQNSSFYGIVGAWVEKPIAHLIGEQWVQKYTLALTKIAVGNVRGKYQAMQLFGGGSLNYNDLLAQGLKEKDELEAGLQNGSWYDTAPPRFFIGAIAAILTPLGLIASGILQNIVSIL